MAVVYCKLICVKVNNLIIFERISLVVNIFVALNDYG